MQQFQELIPCYIFPYPNTSRRDLGSQECWHDCEQRDDQHFCSYGTSHDSKLSGIDEKPGKISFFISLCTPELTLRQTSPYANSSWKNLFSQDLWHTCLKEGQATIKTARPTNIIDYQMARCKVQNISNRNQGCLASSQPNSPTTVRSGYSNTPQKQEWFKITFHDDDREL